MRLEPVAFTPTAGTPPAEADDARAEELIPQFTIECVWRDVSVAARLITPSKFVPGAPADHVEYNWEYERVRGLLDPATVRTGKLLAVPRLQREIVAVAELTLKRGAVMACVPPLKAEQRSILNV